MESQQFMNAGTTAVAGEDALAPLLAAWDEAHPVPGDPEWRHLLDELAHPGTTAAFQRLAGSAV
ncbi:MULTISPECIES: hypothetical protein [unclassified Streptomyces]|uniref:hypothetical protein n=1 Tax=unclassified Streptomyces TaxID=2593676 RepID=UPI00344B258F